MPINTDSEAYKAGFEARGKAGEVSLKNCPFIIDENTPPEKVAEIQQTYTDWVAGHMDSNYHENTDAIAEASKPVPQNVEHIGVESDKE